MATTRLSLVVTRRLFQPCHIKNFNKSIQSALICSSRSRSLSASAKPDPSTFVPGVSTSDLENDKRFEEYFAKNFPDAGFASGDDLDEEELELMKMLGVSDEAEKDGEELVAEEQEKVADILDRLPNDPEMNIRPFLTYKRDLETEEGSKQCRRLRDLNKMIPGIIYGSDPTKGILSIDASSKILVKTPSNFLQREMDRFTYHNFESRVYDLTLFENEDDTEGTVHRVMPRDVQSHPIYHNKFYCCNYLRYFPGKPINIPIVYINEEESPAMKRSGFIAPFNRYVQCVVEDGVKIPEAIELDCTGAKLKEVIRKNRLIFPDGVKSSHRVKENYLIGTLFGRKSDIGDEEDEE